MAEHEDEKRRIDAVDSLLSSYSPSPLPAGTDGHFAPHPIVGEPLPMPEAIPENFICLRGPCIHYIETDVIFDVANTRDASPEHTILRKRTCIVIPGYEWDLTEDCVKECSRWNPELPEDQAVSARNQRREKFYQIQPHLRPDAKENADG